jgi:uncharacterized protein (TIGR00290 family)
MKILLSWSSGKDSAWTLHVLNQLHPGAVAALLTTVNQAFDRVAMHGVRREVLEAQARASRLPLRVVEIPDACPNAIYEQRMGAAVAEAVADGFTHVAFGDLYLQDIRRYREERLAGSGLTPLFPLWEIPTRALARDMIAGGLRARIACVDTRVLDRRFVGRSFDDSLIEDLPANVDPCGENGEFHTCVYDGPMFHELMGLEPGRLESRHPFTWAELTLSGPTPSTRRAPLSGVPEP